MFLFLFIFSRTSLSGIRDVLGTPREDIEYEVLVERLPNGEKEKKRGEKTVHHVFDRQ